MNRKNTVHPNKLNHLLFLTPLLKLMSVLEKWKLRATATQEK